MKRKRTLLERKAARPPSKSNLAALLQSLLLRPEERQAGANIETTEAELIEAIRAELIDWARPVELEVLARLDGCFLAKSVLQRLASSAHNIRGTMKTVSIGTVRTRADAFEAIGRIEAQLGLPVREDTDFGNHWDWANYLAGRGEAISEQPDHSEPEFYFGVPLAPSVMYLPR